MKKELIITGGGRYGYVYTPEMLDAKAEALSILKAKFSEAVNEINTKLGLNVQWKATTSIKGSAIYDEPIKIDKFRNVLQNNSVLYVNAEFEL